MNLSKYSKFQYEITPEKPEFPEKLRKRFDCPHRLYVCGSLPPKRSLAIIGSRESSWGAHKFVSELVQKALKESWAIVSGGAIGIDSAAHEEAVGQGVPTYAVLGCGLDIAYPKINDSLYTKIVDLGGGLISEYPLKTKPNGDRFLERNRIIAAFSRFIIVVEASIKSGTLNTTKHANIMGIPVLAVPGSKGTDWLLKNNKAENISKLDRYLKI